ncbi:MAG: preprotein translocase subunit SecY [Anaeroplasmataceae bacterium]
MLSKIKRIFSNPDIVRKILFTFLILLVFKLGTYLPIPLIDTVGVKQMLDGNSFLTILNTFSGGGLSSFSILALGISPYITAEIVVQMLQMVIPKLKEWSEQGETGKAKSNRVTRYVTVVIAFVQALALLFGLGARPENILQADVLADKGLFWLFYIYMAIVITAGSAFTMWLADLITRHGVGNGSSMIITAGIVTSIPSMFTTLWSKYITDGVSVSSVICFIVIILLYIIMILLVIFMEGAKRRVPIQYANRQGNASSDIPIKLNCAGVIPVIFASTILSIPLTVIGMMGLSTETSDVAKWFDQIFNYQQPIGLVIYVVLIYFFAFFYSFLQMDPDKMADNLSKQGAYIPGYRPGEDTKVQLSKLLFRITLIGATYLAFLALVPIIVSTAFGFTSSEKSVITVGGTSLLIIVGVAIETVKQLETDSDTETYKGIL